MGRDRLFKMSSMILDIHMQNYGAGSLPHIIYKCKSSNFKILKESRYKYSWPQVKQWFLRYDAKSISDKKKKRLTGLDQKL